MAQEVKSDCRFLGFDVDIPNLWEEYCQKMLDPLIIADVETPDGCRIPAAVTFRPPVEPSVRAVVQVNGRIDLIGRFSQVSSPQLLHQLQLDLNKFHLF
jgi:hypothetical protein